MFAITPHMMSNFFNSISKFIILLSIILIVVAGVLIIFLENDYYQGISFKIMFIHVPAAWLSLMIFFSMGISSIIGLIFKSPTSFTISRSLSPIGLIMSIVVLITGSIWGNLTWGTYWVWDARLTTELILLFIYLGLIAVGKMVDDSSKTDRALSLITLFGFINIPLIYFSVVFWNTLHQGFSLGATQAEMASEIKIGLAICTIGVWLVCSSTILLRAKALLLERDYDSHWVQTAI